jgi:transposase
MKKGRSNDDKVGVRPITKTKSSKERPMKLLKYIGMDVHKAMTVIVVIDGTGKVLAESIIETKASTILDFVKSQRGTLHVAFEEGTPATWLYDLIQMHVATVTVCDPRKIIRQGNKSDKVDAKLLAELLRSGDLKPIYHGEKSTRSVKELALSYISLIEDSIRIKNRVKALFRGRGIACSGTGVYTPDQRKEWLDKLDSSAIRARANRQWQELDLIGRLTEEAENDLLAEARKHGVTRILRSVPGIGPIRAAVILGMAATPHRFRTKKQFWGYCGLAVVTRASAEYEMVNGRIYKSKKRPLVRGLNKNYNRAMKTVFKGAAKTVADGVWKSRYEAMVAKGMPQSLARVTLARKIASITLAIWKKGERYDHRKLKTMQAA